MNDKLKQKIKEEMPFLSKEIREAIGSLDWMGKIEKIGKKHLLSDEEIDSLKTETLLVLTGQEEGENYENNIEDEVGTSKEEAVKIADEAEEEIFTPIYDTLIENIKKSGKVKEADAEQNINFILSGGDYSNFIEPRTNAPTPFGEPVNILTPKVEEKTKIPMKPTVKMTDIKK